MLSFILLKRVEAAANFPPAGSNSRNLFQMGSQVVFSCPGSAVVGVCLVVWGCCSQPLTPLCSEIPCGFSPVSPSFPAWAQRDAEQSFQFGDIRVALPPSWGCSVPHIRPFPPALPPQRFQAILCSHCLLFAGNCLGFSSTKLLVWGRNVEGQL